MNIKMKRLLLGLFDVLWPITLVVVALWCLLALGGCISLADAGVNFGSTPEPRTRVVAAPVQASDDEAPGGAEAVLALSEDFAPIADECDGPPDYCAATGDLESLQRAMLAERAEYAANRKRTRMPLRPGTGFRLSAGALAQIGAQGSTLCPAFCDIGCSERPPAACRVPNCVRRVDLAVEVPGSFPQRPSSSHVAARWILPPGGCNEIGECCEREFLNRLVLERACRDGRFGTGFDCVATNQEAFDLAFTTRRGTGLYREYLVPPPPAPRCGDGRVDPGEDCRSCPADAGECPPDPPAPSAPCVLELTCGPNGVRLQAKQDPRYPGVPRVAVPTGEGCDQGIEWKPAGWSTGRIVNVVTPAGVVDCGGGR